MVLAWGPPPQKFWTRTAPGQTPKKRTTGDKRSRHDRRTNTLKSTKERRSQTLPVSGRDQFPIPVRDNRMSSQLSQWRTVVILCPANHPAVCCVTFSFHRSPATSSPPMYLQPSPASPANLTRPYHQTMTLVGRRPSRPSALL